VPWYFSLYWTCIFIIQHFLATSASPEKESCPGIFRCTEIYFMIQDFWGTCGCPENRVCPEIFQARGEAAPPASYAYVSTSVSCNFKQVF